MTHRIIASILRVNHAGEYGAKRIYEGQLAALRHRYLNDNYKDAIQHMYLQELEHLQYFEEEIIRRRIRPTLLHPVWHTLGFALGFASAVLGIKNAMACTAAVENVIDKHYNEQISILKSYSGESSLITKLEQFKKEEIEHKNIGASYIQDIWPQHMILQSIVGHITRAAIWLSKRI